MPGTPDLAAAAAPLVRVTRGRPTDEELAALTAVLMARALAAQAETHLRFAHGNGRPQARWRRLERVTSYRNPVSWR